MAKEKHEHSSLIDQVGAGAVSERFGLKPQGLYMWRVRGVPLLKRLSFAKLAADRGVVPPADFLESLNA